MKFLEGHQADGREICVSIHKLYGHLLVAYVATALYGHSVGGVIMCLLFIRAVHKAVYCQITFICRTEILKPQQKFNVSECCELCK